MLLGIPREIVDGERRPRCFVPHERPAGAGLGGLLEARFGHAALMFPATGALLAALLAAIAALRPAGPG